MIEREPITVLCADDNEQIGGALRQWLSRGGRFRWLGHLASADHLVLEVCRLSPAVVILDIDMPGKDPFDALAELTRTCPDTRVVVFSGHVRLDLIERAIEAGAWGYVSKNDGERDLSVALERVLEGELSLSPEAHGVFAARRIIGERARS